jgi:hypothetical protein
MDEVPEESGKESIDIAEQREIGNSGQNQTAQYRVEVPLPVNHTQTVSNQNSGEMNAE